MISSFRALFRVSGEAVVGELGSLRTFESFGLEPETGHEPESAYILRWLSLVVSPIGFEPMLLIFHFLS